jgi:hypothetical protein
VVDADRLLWLFYDINNQMLQLIAVHCEDAFVLFPALSGEQLKTTIE